MDLHQMVENVRRGIDEVTPDVTEFSRTDVVALAVTCYLKGVIATLEDDNFVEYPELRALVAADLRGVVAEIVGAL